MPKILTDAYKDATFILPYSEDKSECAYVKPLTDTAIDRIRLDAGKEAGTDEALAGRFFLVKFLQQSLTGWQGFYDAGGEEIPFSAEAIKDICECDPEFTTAMAYRIRNVARIGMLEDEKN